MVIVVGAGPVGLLSANLLAMQGVPCMVLDQKEQWDAPKGWILLDGLVLRALR